MSNFLEVDSSNTLEAVVKGKRKREVGLVVPAEYIARTTNKHHAETLSDMLEKKKASLAHFELYFTRQEIVKRACII